MKPTQLRAWMQRHEVLGMFVAVIYLGCRYGWKRRCALLVGLLVASLGANLFLLCSSRSEKLHNPLVSHRFVKTLPAKPSTPETACCDEEPDVTYLLRTGYWFHRQRGEDRETGEWGDFLSVYDGDPSKKGKLIYKTFFDRTGISEILPWTAPTGDPDGPNGFMVVSEYGAGSTLHYSIFAEIKGHIHRVLDVDNGRSWYGLPLEVVNFDGDGPEIISVDDYRDLSLRFGDGKGTARVWKWSEKYGKYVQVRVSIYADRLKPLASKRKIEW